MNQAAAARAIGISPAAFHKRVQKWGLAAALATPRRGTPADVRAAPLPTGRFGGGDGRRLADALAADASPQRKRLAASWPAPLLRKPPPAPCLGDLLRERAAAEGRIGLPDDATTPGHEAHRSDLVEHWEDRKRRRAAAAAKAAQTPTVPLQRACGRAGVRHRTRTGG
jgi:hypothetical protein